MCNPGFEIQIWPLLTSTFPRNLAILLLCFWDWRHSPQTNTSPSMMRCPHSHASWEIFSRCHPTMTTSSRARLTLELLWLSYRKERCTLLVYEEAINFLKPFWIILLYTYDPSHSDTVSVHSCTSPKFGALHYAQSRHKSIP